MATWTEREVIEKLDVGWLLSGDVRADAPFGLINPDRTRTDIVHGVKVSIVRELHKKGFLAPAPVPGKKMMYRKHPRWASSIFDSTNSM